MHKQEYLSYFIPSSQEQPQTKVPVRVRPESRPKTSHYSLSRTKKLLPHIIEEYQYRITNQLLDQKISHPKRDKLITGYFSRQQLKRGNSDKRKVMIRTKAEEKENEQYKHLQKNEYLVPYESSHMKQSGKSCRIQRLYNTFDNLNSSYFNYKNEYLISLQNNRMGKRIINTRSMVQDILTKTHYTYQIYNGKIVNRDRYLRINKNSVKFRSCNKNFGKINNGIKCFFEKTVSQKEKEDNAGTGDACRAKTMHQRPNSRAKSQINMEHHGYETNNPSVLETYGEGSLNFVINQLFIDSNPPIKPDTILVLQVVENDQKLSQIMNNYYAEKNNFVHQVCATEMPDEGIALKDCYTTTSFPYHYISSNQKGQFGLKFRFHYRNQIFLRLLRSQGLDQREIGVIRLNLQPFRSCVAEQFPFRIVKQIRQIDGQSYCREIFESSFKGNLYRFKKGEISSVLRFNYQLYLRTFRPYNEKDSFLENKKQ